MDHRVNFALCRQLQFVGNFFGPQEHFEGTEEAERQLMTWSGSDGVLNMWLKLEVDEVTRVKSQDIG